MQEVGTMEYFNPVLLLILMAEVCLGICAWHSPRFLRRLAAHLLTRADVVDLSREESERRMKVWLDEFGLEADPLSTKTQERVQRVSPGRPKSVRKRLYWPLGASLRPAHLACESLRRTPQNRSSVPAVVPVQNPSFLAICRRVPGEQSGYTKETPRKEEIRCIKLLFKSRFSRGRWPVRCWRKTLSAFLYRTSILRLPQSR